jgi:SAM-dependent methyltransferase
LLAASLIKPKHKLVYEVHQLAVGGSGTRLQKWVVQRCGTIIPITVPLQEALIKSAGEQHRHKFLVAHDGVRAARFANMPTQAQARQKLGWDAGAFIVGYVGRLHTLTQDKGLGTVVDALAHIDGASLALVGGPDDMAAERREHWVSLGLPAGRFLYVGQVLPQDVPLCLAAFDVCVMPHPFTSQFAYYTSPLKLFEYMSSGRAVVASDLPGWADVVTHGHNALLVPPSNVAALAAALRDLKNTPALRKKLGEQARADVFAHYTWAARAANILAHIQNNQSPTQDEPMHRQLYRALRARFTRKITRDHLRQFLTPHATDALTLDVGAKKRPYADLFPNGIAGDIVFDMSEDATFDAHLLPFPDESFEVILCTEVLEHCINPQAVLDEFYRVLKPNGKLLLTTRFVFPLHDVPHDYFRFTRYGLSHLCRNFSSVTVQEEAATVETIAILMQRLGYQVKWKLPFMRLLTFALARLLADGDRWIATEYGEINRRTPVRAILASGYYVHAQK